jgi:hypothetical protein
MKHGLDYFIMKKFMASSVENCSIFSSIKDYLVFWIKQPTASVGGRKQQNKYIQVSESVAYQVN